MERDPYADMFRFRLGDLVRWAEYPTERYQVGQRRWTERELLAPVVTYRLRVVHESGRTLGGYHDWVRDEDLAPWEDAS